jgi:peptidase inhibitor family I36
MNPRHLRWLPMLVAAIVPLLLTTASTPKVARAAGSCSSAQFCLWHDSNQGGSFRGLNASGSYTNLTDFNDQASSLANGTATTICVFVDNNGRGPELAVGSGHHFRDLSKDIATDGGTWNDRISSVGPCR